MAWVLVSLQSSGLGLIELTFQVSGFKIKQNN